MRQFPAMFLGSALLLSACQTGGIERRAEAPAVPGNCDPNGLVQFVGDVAVERFIGQKASAETGAALLAASGARTLRWGGPGMAMTMDFRPDRLTVSYDEAMVITSARCG